MGELGHGPCAANGPFASAANNAYAAGGITRTIPMNSPPNALTFSLLGRAGLDPPRVGKILSRVVLPECRHEIGMTPQQYRNRRCRLISNTQPDYLRRRA